MLGVGNILLRDEGVGVHVIEELSRMDLPQSVKVVDGGTEGFALLDVIHEADVLIVIDAVKTGGEPGSVYKFDLDEFTTALQNFTTSLHQVGLMEVLEVAEILGKRPKTTVIGVEPKTLEIGLGLSPEVQSTVQTVIKTVLDTIAEEIKG